jgi:hypothetical protein
MKSPPSTSVAAVSAQTLLHLLLLLLAVLGSGALQEATAKVSELIVSV